jgi:uncharacterized protein YjdB
MFNRFCFGALLLAGLVLPLTSCSNSPSLTSIVISPATVTVTLAPDGYQQGTNQYTAIGYYTHPGHPAKTEDITSQVTWTSSSTQVASVNSAGLATATGYNPLTGEAWTGNTTITASAPGFNGDVVSNQATFNVTACTSCAGDITKVSVIPATQAVTGLNVPVQFEAIGTTSTGVTVALTALDGVSWVSSDTAVATINSRGLATTTGAGTASITATFTNLDGSGAAGSATITVTLSGTGSAEPLAALTVSPNTQTASAVGQTAQFLAIATTGTGTSVNLTNQTVTVNGQTIGAATWTSSNLSVATVDKATGIAKSVGAGATVITAIGTNPDGSIVTGAATYTVTTSSVSSSESLVSLAIVPASQTLTAANQTADLIAIGTTSTGTTVNLTNQAATVGGSTIKAATWSSSVPSVASINAATGVVTAHASGTTAITAIASNTDGTVVTGVATVTVNIAATEEPLVSLAIVPSSQTLLVANQTANLIAIGTTSTGTTVNLTGQSAKVGSATISAATWKSSVPTVASIDPATGVVTALTSGTAAITATASNTDGTVVTGIATVTVSISGSSSGEPLVSLTIVPSSQTLTTALEAANLIVIGTTSSGTTVNLTNAQVTIGGSTIKAATWESSVSSVASIDPATGIVMAKANGTTAITAMASNPDNTIVTGTATVTVDISATPEPLQSLTIIPGSQSVAYPGQQGQFTAIGTTAAGTTVNLTNQTATVGALTLQAVVWSSSNKGVATVDAATGLVTARGQGTAVIMAVGKNTDGSVVTATAAFAVQNAASEPVTAITIVPGSQSLAANQTAQFIALGTDGTTGLLSDMTTAVTWSSSNKFVATVGANTGLVTPVAVGSTNIIAEYTNPATGTTAASVVSANAPVSITAVTPTPEPLLLLTIIPSGATLDSIDQTAQYLAIGTTSAGAQEDLTNSVAWTSSETEVATFNSTGGTGTTTGGVGSSAGLATVVGAGTTAITAVATNPDGTIVTGVATLTCPSGGSTSSSDGSTVQNVACNLNPANVPKEQLATLTVYGTGNNTTNWYITAPSATGVADVIHCGPTSTNTSPVCVGTYPIGTKVTLTTDVTSGTFGGWSSNCTIAPSPSTQTGTNTCTVTLANDETVAAIFN